MLMDTMLDELTETATTTVEELHGPVAGAGDWREDPVALGVFVESSDHLGLPPLYPIQARDVSVLLGDDPKRIFEEPGQQESVPLAWVPVRSSNIAALAHDGDRHLYVAYLRGKANRHADVDVYRYVGIDPGVFERLLESRSKGRAVRQLAAQRGVEYQKLSEVERHEDVRVQLPWSGRLYQTAVLLWGKGSGKDYLSSIIVTYLVYVLLCLRDPQSYLDLAPGENIDVVNVAYNADQAKQVFFTKLKARMKRWKWLVDHFNVFESAKRVNSHVAGRLEVQINDDHIVFPRAIRCWSRHAQNESYEGLNVIAWVMDEASAFLSKLKRENAEKIFATLSTSARTRFKRRWVGLIISYPRHADDFTMTRHAEAERNPKLGMYASGPFKTWEVNHELGKGEWVEVSPGHKVPVELAPDYELLGFEEAASRFECDPPAAVDALIKFPERLDQAVKKGKPSMIAWEPIITRREVGGPDGTTRLREFVGIKVNSWGKRLPRGTRMFLHGDPALTTDSFALAFGHGVPATVMRHVPAAEVMTAEQMDEHGIAATDVVQWEVDVVRTVIDALLVWRPDPKRDRQVDLLNVREVLLEARKHHRLEAVTFDNWGNFDTVQELARLKVNVENEAWSNPFQLAMYLNARNQFYNDLVTLPDTDTITSELPGAPGALYELKRVQLIEARKIDHPEGGSKDLADAVVRVIQHVTELGKQGGLSFGTVHGHREAYAERRGFHPSERPTTDPRATPSPVTSHLREQEAENRKERPLDREITSAEPRPQSAGSARPVTREELAEIAAGKGSAEPTTADQIQRRWGTIRG